MFIVYDNKKNKWIDGVVVNQVGELIRGLRKLDSTRYVLYKNTELCDNEDFYIYEGHILEVNIDNKIIEGIVYYEEKLGRYVILDFNTETYYPLTDYVAHNSRIVGHQAKGYYE